MSMARCNDGFLPSFASMDSKQQIGPPLTKTFFISKLLVDSVGCGDAGIFGSFNGSGMEHAFGLGGYIFVMSLDNAETDCIFM